MPLAIFGYGSLLDEKVLAERAPGAKHFCRAYLLDYRLVFDKPGITHRYLDIEGASGWRVPGFIIYVTDAQFVDLARREVGYHVVDVMSAIVPEKELLPGTRVVAFIHLGLPYVRMSYLNRCLRGVPEILQQSWLRSIDFRDAVIELDEEPICGQDTLRECDLRSASSEEVQERFNAISCADLEALRRQA